MDYDGHINARGCPGTHLFEPEGEREADDARARDRVKARAKVTGLILERAEQVGKAEDTQVWR
jgi:hypothetical protein